jgi:RNA polymerase sigma factor (sigma-70 family)
MDPMAQSSQRCHMAGPPARLTVREVATLEGDIEQLHPASYSWALSCCRWSRQEAEDVLQAAYLKVLDGRARFDGRSSIKTWLFGVIRNTAAAKQRGRWLEMFGLARWHRDRSAPLDGRGVDEQLAETERRVRVVAALSRLPARQREVLDLVFYHGMTIAEAAEVIGVSIGTARVHYERGKRRLAEQFSVEDCR